MLNYSYEINGKYVAHVILFQQILKDILLV